MTDVEEARVVLDTNVLVSGLFWRGNSHRILLACKSNKLHLITSPELLQEFKAVLEREEKFGLSQEEIEKIVESVAKLAEMVFPNKRLKTIKNHPADNRLLECAEEGEADYIISGDKHLTALRKFKGVKILSPAEAIKLLFP